MPMDINTMRKDGKIFVCSTNIRNVCILYICRHFADEIDLTGLQVDMALRKFQSHFRMPVSQEF